ncbi:hypothetical protein [Synechococcus sp. MVIR-18-1]|uniref:hypothetical protein n=1 Tax=Synechococcus sp. MVIR-18-1 TaxID=1386941 RepID=UPI0016486E63|nr:hypothetical protein [Synechococcus sp. MVIR-18-1]QNI75631.1 hypothetical protein SynMVIR181_00631 [Synechococcus sp. MVIR-18-1]
MNNQELTHRLVYLLQTHRDSLSDEAWDEMDGTPLMDALDALADLEFEVEENGYME